MLPLLKLKKFHKRFWSWPPLQLFLENVQNKLKKPAQNPSKCLNLDPSAKNLSLGFPKPGSAVKAADF